jgi:hypothetical protein
MKKIYYVVEKQLEDIDGFQEATGNKTITAYQILGNRMNKVVEFDMDNTDETRDQLLDELPEEFKDVILIQL